jgi:hypothetical protein
MKIKTMKIITLYFFFFVQVIMLMCAVFSALNEKWSYFFVFFPVAIIFTIEFVGLIVCFKIDKCFAELEKLLNQEKNKEQIDEQSNK